MYKEQSENVSIKQIDVINFVFSQIINQHKPPYLSLSEVYDYIKTSFETAVTEADKLGIKLPTYSVYKPGIDTLKKEYANVCLITSVTQDTYLFLKNKYECERFENVKLPENLGYLGEVMQRDECLSRLGISKNDELNRQNYDGEIELMDYWLLKKFLEKQMDENSNKMNYASHEAYVQTQYLNTDGQLTDEEYNKKSEKIHTYCIEHNYPLAEENDTLQTSYKDILARCECYEDLDYMKNYMEM